MGCTACGKGLVGRELARRLGGQIVSVDSMKVYRRMDIGTAKPDLAARAEIPHHCIDIVEPSGSFSVAQYLAHADRAIESVVVLGAVVLAVGGTSLYIKALSEGLFDAPPAAPAVRSALKRRAETEGLATLHAELGRIDPPAAARIHPNDERRIIRAIEVYQTAGRPISELQRQWDSGRRRYDCVFVGLRRERADLHRRINARVGRMVQAGLKDEVAALLDEPGGMSDQAAQAVGYAEMISHLRGELSLDEAAERMKISTRRLARKQRTWQRRFADARWFDVSAQSPVGKIVEEILAVIRFE